MTSALVPMLEVATNGCDIVSDLRRIQSFSPSVGSAAELGLWRVRGKIRSVVVVGGPALARIVSRGACALLGVPCSFVDALD